MAGKPTTASSLPKRPVVKAVGVGTVGLALLKAKGQA